MGQKEKLRFIQLNVLNFNRFSSKLVSMLIIIYKIITFDVSHISMFIYQ